MITDRQITEAERLLEILKREHAALLQGDLAAIESIIAEKQAAARELEAITRNLQAQTEGRTEPPALAQRLAALAVECRRQNEINGGMVAAGLRHTQQVLALLQGQRPGEALYSRAGNTTAGETLGRPLASA